MRLGPRSALAVMLMATMLSVCGKKPSESTLPTPPPTTPPPPPPRAPPPPPHDL